MLPSSIKMVNILYYVSFTTIRGKVPRAASVALSVSSWAELGLGGWSCVCVRARTCACACTRVSGVLLGDRVGKGSLTPRSFPSLCSSELQKKKIN